MFNPFKKWFITMIHKGDLKDTNSLKDILGKYRGDWSLQLTIRGKNKQVKNDTYRMTITTGTQIRTICSVIWDDYSKTSLPRVFHERWIINNKAMEVFH